MFANRYTAVVDACVLVSAPKRDLILTLARAEMFRFRWTKRIMTETQAALSKMFEERIGDREQAQERSTASCDAMQEAFPEAMIYGDFSEVPKYEFAPDIDDHHIIHAAILCKASMIVTDNIKDFPQTPLEPYELEVKTADEFIADAIDLDRVRTAEAVKGLRARLSNPPISAKELLDKWEQSHGLLQTVGLLREYEGLI